jgi:HPt (histidine-containing phosphotransfer) domain-containing protein
VTDPTQHPAHTEEGPKDPILLELLPEFLDAWQTDLSETWRGILERQDAKELERFGHTIKGSFLQFGYRSLSAVGRAIMDDAARNDWAAATVRVEELAAIVNTMKHTSSSQS